MLNFTDDTNFNQWNDLAVYLNNFAARNWTGPSLYRATLSMYDGAFLYIANCTECSKEFSNY